MRRLLLLAALAAPAVGRAAVNLPNNAKLERVDFERHVMGLFGRMGCNSGSCHGSFQGKGGFRLSLFGYDPDKDYLALTREALGRRVDTAEPDNSLLLLKATGAVCTVAATGKGFRITATQVRAVNQVTAGPHPPCTRAALTGALERALHKRSLAPSHLSRGWVCAGNYARADFIALHDGTGDDIVEVFRGKGRQWQSVGRGRICLDGELPAPIYVACTVD